MRIPRNIKTMELDFTKRISMNFPPKKYGKSLSLYIYIYHFISNILCFVFPHSGQKNNGFHKRNFHEFPTQKILEIYIYIHRFFCTHTHTHIYIYIWFSSIYFVFPKTRKKMDARAKNVGSRCLVILVLLMLHRVLVGWSGASVWENFNTISAWRFKTPKIEAYAGPSQSNQTRSNSIFRHLVCNESWAGGRVGGGFFVLPKNFTLLRHCIRKLG